MDTPGEQQPASFLLDTGILLAYIRAGALGQYVEERYQLRAQPYKPLISIVSVGEIRALARQFGWGNHKKASMRRLLRELVQVDISNEAILDAYAELADFTRRPPGQTVPQNDLWIAATAKVTGTTLLTLDTDFDQFDPGHISHEYIDQRAGKGQTRQ